MLEQRITSLCIHYQLHRFHVSRFLFVINLTLILNELLCTRGFEYSLITNWPDSLVHASPFMCHSYSVCSNDSISSKQNSSEILGKHTGKISAIWIF